MKRRLATTAELLAEQVTALDSLAKHATRTIRLDTVTGLYVIENKATREVIGRYDTYHEARKAR